MAGRFANATFAFRKNFTLPDKDMVRWFPGHMQKGVLQVQHMLKNIDCVVELHDARIPFSGRNPRFNDIISLRPHVLVYNKKDLCDLREKHLILSKLKSEGVDQVMFTQSTVSTKNSFMSKELFSMVTNAIEARPRYHRAELNEFNLLVLGVPNIGKSTFLNYLRRLNTTHHKKAALVGAKAGVTKSVGHRVRVNFDPPIFLIDTPGILTPTVPNIHVGMKLALCGCMPDHYVGEEYIVDYMLYWMNKQQKFGYVKYFELDGPIDDVLPFLKHVALKNKLIKKIKSAETRQFVHIPDFSGAANIVLKSFRKGDLGKFMLDDDLL
ncbi:LOW QUALITY PROTEIN: mitochondrial ribosome-associated GTPase 1-like [Pecten maximus]|uniref:LOW QUALITY PROTEIN: mitochondrial ribosome-associated GTPase 1-like n=1 Tax=Pecten maximus TaxID=6579 RepID=UPI0014589C05|nr:LOW QUALITY PROTEIN: mitochondrial ribosome-associated GTPase 1-like [Pecten maximus]